MKLAALLTALAAPLLFVSAAADEPPVVLLRGAGAAIASDAEGTEVSFGIPEFLAQPEYCTKSCYRDCSCYSGSNDCYPKCCTKNKGNCPNNHMPPCEPPNENRNPPNFDSSDPNSCSSSDSGGGDRDSRCSDSSDCTSSQYCKFDTGDCEADSKGRCTDGGRDDKGCTRNIARVCGCDQREYDNECIAENYGVTIDYEDDCDDAGRTARDFDGTCRRSSDCSSGYYCKPLFEECSTEDRDGFCTLIPNSKDDCKNLPSDNVCTCDGETEKNECRAEYESQGVKHRGECSGSDSSSDSGGGDRDSRCSDTSDCTSSQYCKFDTGDCEPDSKGRCTDGGRDDKGCNGNIARVCGCDQREYDNECIAENYGVTIDYEDDCDDAGRTARDFDGTCRHGGECGSGYYCKPLFGECSTNDRDGFCTLIPNSKDDCKNLPSDNVCTCDGKTEKNECRAEYESQGVKHRGECSGSDSSSDSGGGDRDSRCSDTSDCTSSQYCKFDTGDCEPDSKGRCTDGGRDDKGCNRNIARVCGCDQREYDNECIAENYGVTIDYEDDCDDAGRTARDFDGTCRHGGECGSGYYCKPLFGECSTNDRDGFCTLIPNSKDDCKKLPNDNVCTCDGKTEKNECRAEYDSQGVKHRGEC